MDWSGSLVFSLLAAGVELAVAGTLELRLFLALGRRPCSRALASIVQFVPRPAARSRASVMLWTVALAACQVAPLVRERVIGGGTVPPDHISGVAVIVAEVLFGVWLLLDSSSGFERPE